MSDPVGLFGDREVALVDLLDRLLAGGVVLPGDVTISLAGVDLVRVSLRALITSIAPVDDGPCRMESCVQPGSVEPGSVEPGGMEPGGVEPGSVEPTR